MNINWKNSNLIVGETEKIAINLENLKKSNKISIKFSIWFFIDFLVENTNDP